jgi:hypothetical protein
MSLNRVETAEFVFELNDAEYQRAIDFLGCMSQPTAKIVGGSFGEIFPKIDGDFVQITEGAATKIPEQVFLKTETPGGVQQKVPMPEKITGAPNCVGGHMCCTVPAYIGTKVIGAEPMSLAKFNSKFGRKITPVDKEGYHVQYDNPDGTLYDSWSPKDVFESAYRKIDDGITFGDAVFFLKQGNKVARKGWNGKVWLMVVPEELAATISFQYAALNSAPWIGMKTADQKFVPWLASQTDVLADDWMVIE